MSRRRRRKLTEKEVAEIATRRLNEIKNSKEIIKKVRGSLTKVKPQACCSTCINGEDRFGGWTCGYQGTWCRLLYINIKIVSNSSKAFNGQNVQALNLCKLYRKK